MKTSELKQSNYLKKEDCGDDGILVTITGLKQENVAPDGKPEQLKHVLTLREAKPLVLNGTNAKLIEKALGSDETDDWIGKQVVLFNDENVTYMDEVVGGVRCDVTRTKRYHAKLEKSPAAGNGKKSSAPPAFDPDDPDQIPF